MFFEAVVLQVLETLQEQNEHDEQGVFVNFEDNYIVRNRKNRSAFSRYSIKILNFYDVTVAGAPTINNNVERWHRAFNNMVKLG